MAVMGHLLASPPGKFLEVGTDQLLTGYFRGGGSASGGDTRDKRESEEQGDTSGLASSPKWSYLLKDVERDLEGTNHRAEALAEKCGTKNEATFKDEGDNSR